MFTAETTKLMAPILDAAAVSAFGSVKNPLSLGTIGLDLAGTTGVARSLGAAVTGGTTLSERLGTFAGFSGISDALGKSTFAIKPATPSVRWGAQFEQTITALTALPDSTRRSLIGDIGTFFDDLNLTSSPPLSEAGPTATEPPPTPVEDLDVDVVADELAQLDPGQQQIVAFLLALAFVVFNITDEHTARLVADGIDLAAEAKQWTDLGVNPAADMIHDNDYVTVASVLGLPGLAWIVSRFIAWIRSVDS